MRRQKAVFTKIVLLVIFSLGLWWRLTRLPEYPAGFTPDEASQGYTAYSILKTGRDEWGAKLPVNLRSFGDFKAPVYTYLLVPSIAVFGLNEQAVRFPNALLGGLSLIVLFYLTGELFRDKPKLEREILALMAAGLLAINPWHIALSRGGFEANLTNFFLPLAVLFFLRGLNKPLYLWLSSVVFGLNLFTYHSAKLVTPVLVLLLYCWKRKSLSPRRVFLPGVLLLVFVGLMIVGLTSGGGARVKDIGLLSGGWQAVADNRFVAGYLGLTDSAARLFNNKLTFALTEFTDSYLLYLSPAFFFGHGAGEATYGMIPGVGLLYLFQLPFLVYSFYRLFRFRAKVDLFCWTWFLVGLVPAALSRGVGYHANRVAIVIPALSVMTALGLYHFWVEVRGSKIANYCYLLIVVIIAVSVANFYHHYFYYGPVVNAPKMNYGWKQVGEYLIDHPAKQVVISRRLSEPQAYLMFYLKMDPVWVQRQTPAWLAYQKDGGRFVDQQSDYSLGRFRVKNLSFPEDIQAGGVYYIGVPADFGGTTPAVLKNIYYPGPGQKIALQIVNYDERP